MKISLTSICKQIFGAGSVADAMKQATGVQSAGDALQQSTVGKGKNTGKVKGGRK